jgi:hypothetical protein
VTALHDNQDAELANVDVQAASGQTATLHTTQQHLFWNATRKTWTNASALRKDDLLLAPDGALARVVQVYTFNGRHDMRNLTVADLHTYYVMAGDTMSMVESNL